MTHPRTETELLENDWVSIENDGHVSESPKTSFDPLKKIKETFASTMDYQLKAQIEAIGDNASHLVAKKIQRALYGDSERYGVVRDTDQVVDIYYKNSPILNKLMKSATGFSIDDFINSLPIGVKQLAAPLRTYLENMIANLLIEQLSQLSVKKATTATLMAASHYTQAQINQYINQQFSGESKDPEIQALLKAKVIQDSAKKSVNIESILRDEATTDGISLRDVLNFYKAQIQVKLNNSLREALVKGISEAAGHVSAELVEKGVNYAEAASATTAVATGLTGFLPATALSAGVAYALEKAKLPAQQYASSRAKDNARKAAQHFLPSEIISVDYDALGKASYSTVKDEETDIEFALLDIIQPTFTRWAEEKYQATKTTLTQVLNDLRRCFTLNQNQQDTKIPEVIQNWFRDNDFPKLKAIREAYVESERTLKNLDLQLMNICEYAYGIREDINGEYVPNRRKGLALCQTQLESILQKIEEAKAKPELISNRYRQVENPKRRQDLVQGANQRIEGLSKDMSTYVKRVKDAINEAEKDLREEVTVQSAIRITP
jgi:hypothetical protein